MPIHSPHAWLLRIGGQRHGITGDSKDSICSGRDTKHESDGSKAEERKRAVTAIFPVFGEPAATAEPGDGALDNPLLGFDDETFAAVATFDDFDLQVRHDARDSALEDRAGIGAVCEQLPQERELSKQGGDQQHPAVEVLNVSGGHQRVQQQTEFVDENVAFLPLISLPASKPCGSTAEPLFPRS